MAEAIDLDAIAVIYDGDYLSSVPNTYKSFLELLRDKAGLTNEEFENKTVYKGDFPIASKKDYIRAIRSCKDEGIMQIDLVSNELDEKEGIGEKDYLKFLELKEPEEPIKINKEEGEESNEESVKGSYGKNILMGGKASERIIDSNQLSKTQEVDTSKDDYDLKNEDFINEISNMIKNGKILNDKCTEYYIYDNPITYCKYLNSQF